MLFSLIDYTDVILHTSARLFIYIAYGIYKDSTRIDLKLVDNLIKVNNRNKINSDFVGKHMSK